MNKKNVILEIIRHPAIKRILEARKIPTSIVARLIVEELMEQQIDPEGTDNIKKLEDVVETARVHLDDINKISKEQIEPNDLDSLLPEIIGFIEILEQETPLANPQDWPKKKEKITVVANQKNYNRASFEILGVLQKWVGTEQQPGAIRKISAEIQKLRGDSRPESQNKIPDLSKALQDYLKVYIDIIEFSAEIIKVANQKPDPNERKKLVEALLKAKDIKTFLAIYKKLAGEDYKEQFIGTVKVVKALIDLKKQLSDNPDELLEKGIALLDKNYIEKELYMDLEQISEKIRDKIFELVTEIKLDQEPEKFMKQPFENLLLDLRKVGDMKTKLEVISKRFPEYMTPDNGLKTLDDLNEYKNLFMALVGGRTMEKGALDEEEEGKPTLSGQQEARQFLIGIIAYYKLSEKENYEKIKADDEKFKKELQRIMKAADHMDSFITTSC